MPSFQPALLSHAPHLLPLIRAYYEYDGIRFEPSRAEAAVNNLLSDSSLGRAWLVRLDDTLVGYAIVAFGFDVEFGGRDALITDLYFKPEFRRCGLGKSTLDFIFGECRKLGLGAIHLHVESDNTEAQALYRKTGFEPHDRIPMTLRLS